MIDPILGTCGDYPPMIINPYAFSTGSVALAVASFASNTYGSSTSHIIPIPSGTEVGDLLIGAFRSSASTGTVTPPTGWTFFTGTNSRAFYRFATADDLVNPQTITFITSRGCAIVTLRVVGAASVFGAAANTTDPPNVNGDESDDFLGLTFTCSSTSRNTLGGDPTPPTGTTIQTDWTVPTSSTNTVGHSVFGASGALTAAASWNPDAWVPVGTFTSPASYTFLIKPA